MIRGLRSVIARMMLLGLHRFGVLIKIVPPRPQLRLMADLESTPWVAAVQPDGELIGSTNDRDDNYGLPVNDAANLDQFLGLLKSAAPSLTESESQTIRKHFMGQLIR